MTQPVLDKLHQFSLAAARATAAVAAAAAAAAAAGVTDGHAGPQGQATLSADDVLALGRQLQSRPGIGSLAPQPHHQPQQQQAQSGAQAHFDPSLPQHVQSAARVLTTLSVMGERGSLVSLSLAPQQPHQQQQPPHGTMDGASTGQQSLHSHQSHVAQPSSLVLPLPPEHLICPLTQLLLVDPVRSRLCGHTYSRSAVLSSYINRPQQQPQPAQATTTAATAAAAAAAPPARVLHCPVKNCNHPVLPEYVGPDIAASQQLLKYALDSTRGAMARHRVFVSIACSVLLYGLDVIIYWTGIYVCQLKTERYVIGDFGLCKANFRFTNANSYIIDLDHLTPYTTPPNTPNKPTNCSSTLIRVCPLYISTLHAFSKAPRIIRRLLLTQKQPPPPPTAAAPVPPAAAGIR